MGKKRSWLHREEPEIWDPAGLLDNADESSENISVYDAADIWASNGKDDDYTFGYSRNELEDAFNS